MDSSKKMIVIALVLVIAASSLLVVLNNNSISGERTVTDVRGRDVPIPNDVNRVVCLSAGSVRLVSYFDAVDKIVGIGKDDSEVNAAYYYATYRIAYPKIAGITNVGSETSIAAIKDVSPQVIISSKANASDLDLLQEKTGVPVIGVGAEGSIVVGDSAFEKDIKLIGKVLNKSQRADELMNGINSIKNDLIQMSKKVDTKYKAYAGGIMYNRASSFCMSSSNYISFDLGGVSNVTKDVNPLPYEVNIGDVKNSNPDYVFIDAMKLKQTKDDYNRDAIKLPMASTAAVQNDHIYSLFAWKYFGTNWESELMNAYYIGNLVYPSEYNYNVEEKINYVLGVFYKNSDISVAMVKEKQPDSAVWLDW